MAFVFLLDIECFYRVWLWVMGLEGNTHLPQYFSPAIWQGCHGQLDNKVCGTERENLNPKLHLKEKPKKIFSMSKQHILTLSELFFAFPYD